MAAALATTAPIVNITEARSPTFLALVALIAKSRPLPGSSRMKGSLTMALVAAIVLTVTIATG